MAAEEDGDGRGVRGEFLGGGVPRREETLTWGCSAGPSEGNERGGWSYVIIESFFLFALLLSHPPRLPLTNRWALTDRALSSASRSLSLTRVTNRRAAAASAKEDRDERQVGDQQHLSLLRWWFAPQVGRMRKGLHPQMQWISYVTQSGRLINIMMTKVNHTGKVYHMRAKRQMAQSLGQIAKFKRRYEQDAPEENQDKDNAV
ncbi:hypothetical protein CFC21_078355 [Triticum aestivum]|uniref:Uncharacterized protein n=2 Tax=Triticum aestivum TaxID=4565 RepID=A0A3B6MTZ3_WHEAT|nr:hypothetical protein CFC21_078355 [Triticum aestivum]